ncbi:hypothetical protein TNCV_3832011 [Trichonephila clavipes]|nr:hypothetical protein TNCV_3832011 [Trichonephila clavipes]
MSTVEEGFPLTGEEWKAACTLTTRTRDPTLKERESLSPSVNEDLPSRNVDAHLICLSSKSSPVGVVVWRKVYQLRCRLRHLTMVKNYKVRHQ